MAELLHPETAAAPPPAQSAVDWPGSLIGLLGRLDTLRAEFVGRRIAPDTEALIGHAEAMVQAAEDLAKRTTFPDALAEMQARALSKAGAFFTAANSLKKAPTKSLFFTMLNALTDSDSPPEAVRACLLSSVEVLNSYFMLFTEQFKSSASARGWVDAASAFVAEYKQLIRDLPGR